MAQGRCAGCGRTDSIRKVSQHIVDCPEYMHLFATEPARCLTPAAEFERYQREDNSALARAGRRGARLSVRFAEINQLQARSEARWKRPKDILE